MAYFNHAFKKTIVMNSYLAPVPATPTAASGALTPGQLSIYDAKSWAPLDVTAPVSACQFIIAAGSPYVDDKVGPFHGGYKESIKSKGIVGKYINKIWDGLSNPAQQSILHIGTTAYTMDKSTAGCCPKFLCGENYHLRVDVKGSAALRMLNHNAYEEITAYTGCCPDGTVTPTEVGPGFVMLEWAKGIWDSVILTGGSPDGGASNAAPFIIPVVQTSNAAEVAAGHVGHLFYPPGTSAAVMLAGRNAVIAVTGQGLGTITAVTWDDATAPTTAFTAGDCAGLVLVGAYQETTFGDCTFQPSDFYAVDPLRLYASEVDLNGDPCEFTGICILDECKGRKANGLGETAARDFIMSESYRQNFMATDLRVREITQGNDMLGTGNGQVDRTGTYDRLMIMHSVPRFNNPTGTFDNDQYIVEILTPTAIRAGARATLRADIVELLEVSNNQGCIVQTAEAGAACATPSIVVAV